MRIYRYPQESDWSTILQRPALNLAGLYSGVEDILSQVKSRGDKALYALEERFDGVILESLSVPENEILNASQLLSTELKRAIEDAARNIRIFHESQQFHTKRVETTPGVVCWQKAVAIESVGLYIPGGGAPLFSTVLMLAIPAKIAGCKEIVLSTPPQKDGTIHPAILYAAKVAGVNRLYKIGGAQAIAAMAYGTETIPKVSKIFGPGNPYVTAAKQIVSLRDVAIDMPAGPSEVEVIADSSSNPHFVAADLLSQAEHGTDSQSILLTTSEDLLESVNREIDRQLQLLPRRDVAEKSLQHSCLILLRSNEEIIRMTNEYAPEHLIIESDNYADMADRIVNAGSVFLGSYTPESAGDYASGTNHTLPTSGYAKSYSGVNLDSFIRKITFQEISKEGLAHLAPTIEIMASGERLDAHRNAVTIRLENYERAKRTY